MLESARPLGRVLGAMIGTLGAREVVLVGPMTAFGQPWLDEVRAETQRSALALLVDQSSIHLGTTGADVVELGAAAMLMTSELGLAFCAMTISQHREDHRASPVEDAAGRRAADGLIVTAGALASGPSRQRLRPSDGRDQGGGVMHTKRWTIAGTALATLALTASSIGVVAQDEAAVGVPTVPTGYAELDQALGGDSRSRAPRSRMQTQWIGGEGDNFEPRPLPLRGGDGHRHQRG